MSAPYFCKLPSNWDSMHQNPSWMHIFTLRDELNTYIYTRDHHGFL
jgi:hypothetical protein